MTTSDHLWTRITLTPCQQTPDAPLHRRQVCVVYCLDSQFVTDTPKFIAGCLQVLAAMAQLEAPHVSVLTKVDLIPDKARILPHVSRAQGCIAGEILNNSVAFPSQLERCSSLFDSSLV